MGLGQAAPQDYTAGMRHLYSPGWAVTTSPYSRPSQSSSSSTVRESLLAGLGRNSQKAQSGHSRNRVAGSAGHRFTPSRAGQRQHVPV